MVARHRCQQVTHSVLCKNPGRSGVAFFTSYTSAKASGAVTPRHASTAFLVPAGHGHVQGPVSKVSTEEIFHVLVQQAAAAGGK